MAAISRKMTAASLLTDAIEILRQSLFIKLNAGQGPIQACFCPAGGPSRRGYRAFDRICRFAPMHTRGKGMLQRGTTGAAAPRR